MSDSKRRNAGFSLVELIIVIAIMVVLVGVLAPQFVKYVEKSRIGTDTTNAQEIAAGVAAAIADPDFSDADVKKLSSTFSGGAEVPKGTVGSSSVPLIQGMDKFPSFKSKISGQTAAQWTIQIDGNDSVKVLCTTTSWQGKSGVSSPVEMYPNADNFTK